MLIDQRIPYSSPRLGVKQAPVTEDSTRNEIRII